MQAMIITAYKDAQGLRRMLAALSRHALCFVHVDASGPISAQEAQEMGSMDNVYVVRRYRINWGSIYHLHALLDLMRAALSDERVTHLHLISAQDFPTVSWTEFASFFEEDDRIHMQSLSTADYPELWHRYRHYHFMHLINYRDMSERTQNLIGRLDRWQETLRIHRKLELPRKGLVWLSLPREAARYALCAPQNRRLLRSLRYTYIPEEFYFQNAFTGTPWENKITGNALRFSIWDKPERGLPAELTQEDLAAVDASGCLFCRKVRTDSNLYEILEHRWLG